MSSLITGTCILIVFQWICDTSGFVLWRCSLLPLCSRSRACKDLFTAAPPYARELRVTISLKDRNDANNIGIVEGLRKKYFPILVLNENILVRTTRGTVCTVVSRVA